MLCGGYKSLIKSYSHDKSFDFKSEILTQYFGVEKGDHQKIRGHQNYIDQSESVAGPNNNDFWTGCTSALRPQHTSSGIIL